MPVVPVLKHSITLMNVSIRVKGIVVTYGHYQWVLFRLMPLDYTICTAMYGSGRKIAGTIIIRMHHMMARLGKNRMLVIVIIERYVAVLGVISSPGIYAQLVDFGMILRKSKAT